MFETSLNTFNKFRQRLLVCPPEKTQLFFKKIWVALDTVPTVTPFFNKNIIWFRTKIQPLSPLLKTRHTLKCLDCSKCSAVRCSYRCFVNFSKLVWRLKDESHIPALKCSIVCKAKPYSSDAMHCQLYLVETLAIWRADPNTALNKIRNAFVLQLFF